MVACLNTFKSASQRDLRILRVLEIFAFSEQQCFNSEWGSDRI